MNFFNSWNFGPACKKVDPVRVHFAMAVKLYGSIFTALFNLMIKMFWKGLKLSEFKYILFLTTFNYLGLLWGMVDPISKFNALDHTTIIKHFVVDRDPRGSLVDLKSFSKFKSYRKKNQSFCY